MNKLFKGITAAVLALVMLTFGAPIWATTDETSGPISISVEISGSTSLSISYLNTATGTAGTGTLGFDLSGRNLSDPSTYWSVADNCLEVAYSSDYAWGIRIVTNNLDLLPSGSTISNYIAGNAVAPGDDGDYGTDDDVLAYSGLVADSDLDSGTSGEDPSARAALAWQAYDEWDSGYTAYVPVSTIAADNSIDDTNVGSAWSPDCDDWHYIGDKSDDGFVDAIYDGTDLTYPMVAVGLPGSNGSLIPATGGNTTGSMVSLADNDFVILIAARFASTNWSEGVATPYLLEPDTYETSLYIELIHE